ncbi:hypothetical protein ACN28I_39040 [Archangium gephyra]|uniref:hypothetical protein n=1 Tax=Archangium gephyra TaxID=48 RepID=UPI003B7B01CD
MTVTKKPCWWMASTAVSSTACSSRQRISSPAVCTSASVSRRVLASPSASNSISSRSSGRGPAPRRMHQVRSSPPAPRTRTQTVSGNPCPRAASACSGSNHD